jgi:hypothetical protein
VSASKASYFSLGCKSNISNQIGFTANNYNKRSKKDVF